MSHTTSHHDLISTDIIIVCSVTVINNHSLGSILTITLLDLVKQTKVTNTVYAIETKKISVCRYDLFM